MSTHNICFCGEIRKILRGYPLVSDTMVLVRLGCHCPHMQYGLFFWPGSVESQQADLDKFPG